VRTLLDWHDVGPLAVDTIARVLWLMATLKASLHAIATRFVWPVGETTLRRGIAGQLPDPATLADALHRRLLAFVPRRRPAKGYLVAIDTHGVGFYGRRNTPGTVGGQRKNGTRRYFLYATAVVVERGQRYTLALAAVESGRPMDALVPLLDQIAAAGIKVRKLLLDKGFFAAEVFDLLATRRLPYIAAVPHRRHHGPRNLWAAGDDTHHTLTSHARRGRRVSVRLRLVRTTWTHRDGSVSEQVYAVRGLRGGADLGAEARRWYKRRFGIESSYRQLRQAKAPTTGKDRSWRLLLIGLALLFRQIWVALTQAAVAGGSRWSPQTALERLRQQMAADLVRGLDEHHTVRLHHGSASEFTGKSR
jgi:hypothetical protein